MALLLLKLLLLLLSLPPPDLCGGVGREVQPGFVVAPAEKKKFLNLFLWEFFFFSPCIEVPRDGVRRPVYVRVVRLVLGRRGHESAPPSPPLPLLFLLLLSLLLLTAFLLRMENHFDKIYFSKNLFVSLACLSASMSSLSLRAVPSLAASDWLSAAAAAAAAAEAGLVAEKREPDARLRFCWNINMDF